MNPMPLGEMPLDIFLAEYWQKKPLLIRNALANITSPASAEVLAGLACEDEVESRLIIQKEKQWELQHGPFNETTFANLPASHWTLLVQAVDHYLPAAARLLEQFNFIPRWRIDDIMMSVASDGGGVGPHFDHYDVFLVQTHGKRQWDIGGKYDDDSLLQENLPVKILQTFDAEQRWLLSPGDILYLPPGVGHNGIAVGNACITCSVGFRAPSHSDILREYTDYIGDQLNESMRYQDVDLNTQCNPGEITPQTLQNIQNILHRYTENPAAISDWFGRYATTPKYPTDEYADHEASYSIEELITHLTHHGEVIRNESSRFAYYKQDQQHRLFVDGEEIDSGDETNQLIEALCSKIQITSEDFELSANNLDLLGTLLQQGAIYLNTP